MKRRKSFVVFGTGHSSIAAVFVWSVTTLLVLMTCPRYTTSRRNTLHFLRLSLSPSQRNRLSTSRTQRTLSANDMSCTRMSSKYTRQAVHGKQRSTSSTSLQYQWRTQSSPCPSPPASSHCSGPRSRTTKNRRGPQE